MSIAVLNQVYGECRRLAAAGSTVARGDFRLKKLLPPLDAAGAKAPVFARVAEAARVVTDGPEDVTAGGLLELTALVTAVLYTQGDTAVPGELASIPSAGLGGAANTSARLLKPLLEALRSTGPGRLELVKEAHERGAFADLRLVGPAVKALDDPYAEVADFLTETVLPNYGPAVASLVCADYDPKGGKGHARRLKLLHRLDPEGSRELVLGGLDGSKDVRVAAVSCLGVDNLALLLEQATGKNKEVRAAAFEALARFDDPDALAMLAKGLAGKDNEAVARAIQHGGNPAAVGVLVEAVRAGVTVLSPKAAKKETGEQISRLITIVRALPASVAADGVLADLFDRRAELARLKGEARSGADLNQAVVGALATGTDALKRRLATTHADLDSHALELAATAGRRVLSPAEFFSAFSPYLADSRKAGSDVYTRQSAVVSALNGHTRYYWAVDADRELPPPDPRWLDAAVKHRLVGLVQAVGRPGHRPSEVLLSAEFDDRLKTTKGREELPDVLSAMIHTGHPDAAECLVKVVERETKLATSHLYWYCRLVPKLPKDALPVLEAVAPKLPARERDEWVRAVEELREKSDAHGS